MPGRQYTQANSGYRYGFNGKENDKDISVGGQDYGMRIYDTRIGKFLSVDPLTKSYPFYTPYQFAGNKPVLANDLDGLEEVAYPVVAALKSLKTLAQVTDKVIIGGIGVSAAAGIGMASASFKANLSLAADPLGNFAVSGGYMGFVDLFHTYGGKSYDILNTGNEGGLASGSFYLGAAAGIGCSAGFFDFGKGKQYVGGLSGRFSELDFSFGPIGVTVSATADNNHDFVGIQVVLVKVLVLDLGWAIPTPKYLLFRKEMYINM